MDAPAFCRVTGGNVRSVADSPADRTADTAEERHLLERIRRDYRQLDAEHTAMIARFRRGESKEVRLQHQRMTPQSRHDAVRRALLVGKFRHWQALTF